MADWDEEIAGIWPTMKEQNFPTIFQQARETVEQDVAMLIKCLTDKKVEMFAEIDRLESEFTIKQEQQRKSLNKLSSLKSQTYELNEDSLLEIQENVANEIQKGINKLSLEIESAKNPDYLIEIQWEICMNCTPSKIEQSHIAIIDPSTPKPVIQELPVPAQPKRRNRRNNKHKLKCNDQKNSPNWREYDKYDSYHSGRQYNSSYQSDDWR